MTADARAQALQAFGYSAREAAFLGTAALHSGYFLGRQFSGFIGTPRGKALAQFIGRLVALHHAKVMAIGGGAHLYHLCAKPLYAALQDPENRHRRCRPWLGIKGKVMTLDYVLQHRHRRFLVTEEDRVRYLVDTCRMDRRLLPQRRYPGRAGDQGRPRYFVDRLPIAVARDPHDPSAIAFAYIDAGGASRDGFRTYLDQYRPLLQALPDWRIVYVTASSHGCAEARTAFQRAWGSTARDAETARWAALREYFHIRRLYESKQFAALSKAKLDAFRGMRHTFGQPHVDVWYEQWRRDGDGALTSTPDGGGETTAGRLAMCVLQPSYALFEPLLRV